MRVEEIHSVILAGGLGTRLRGVLRSVPKPMATVEGRPFVEWVARWLAASGVRSATLSTGYLGETIERHFAARPVAGLAIDCVREDRALGTAGGFLNAAHGSGRAPGGWLVLNGDSLTFADVSALVGRVAAGTEAAMVARLVEDAGRYGRLDVGPDGLLRRFAEKEPDAGSGGPGLINAGVYLLRPALLETFPARVPLSFELDVFPAWLGRGVPIAAVESDAPFLDIGTEASLARADEFIRRNRGRFP
jgi:D-glycero-alpha-D-manno-heptose 1-phosphate guanylyltransferase